MGRWTGGENRESVEEEEEDGEVYGDTPTDAGFGMGSEWLTALMVLTACLYACMRARQEPEMDWIAERKKTRRVWKEKVKVGCYGY